MAEHQINAAALTTFDVASDGSHVRMHIRDQEGQPASLILPAKCLNQLLMTLPTMVQTALRNRHGNDTTRLVHRIDECTLESGEVDARGVQQLILTMISGGFAASYASSPETLASIARSILNQIPGLVESETAPRLLS